MFFSILADAYSSRFKQTFQRSWLSRMMTMIYTVGRFAGLGVRTRRSNFSVELQDKALERQIFEEEESAQLNKRGRFEGEKNDPRIQEEATTATEEAEEGKGQADQSSLNSSSSAGQEKEKGGSKEQHLAEALVMLIVDTKEHLEELIRSDGGAGGKTIKVVVNNLMGES